MRNYAKFQEDIPRFSVIISNNRINIVSICNDFCNEPHGWDIHSSMTRNIIIRILIVETTHTTEMVHCFGVWDREGQSAYLFIILWIVHKCICMYNVK